MKAVIYNEYGPPEVLKLQEVDKPVPKDNEILVKIHAVSVGYGDLLARNFKAVTGREFNMPGILLFPARLDFGFNKPKRNILGTEFSGVVEEIGKNVTMFKTGDQVFGYRGQNFGANAEFLCMKEHGCIAQKPANMTDEEAASIPYGAVTALSLLRNTKIREGQKVLIFGASGGIGSAAVQLAGKHFGAEVTGVSGTSKVEFVRKLGADKVIDYNMEDFTRNGETYDLIFDILGKGSFSKFKNSLKPDGIYLLASFKTKKLLQMLWTRIVGGKRVICALAPEKAEDLIFVKDLVEKGQFTTVIDKRFPLEQASEAHRYLEGGKAKGKVVLTVKKEV